jgi:hypothetical protein
MELDVSSDTQPALSFMSMWNVQVCYWHAQVQIRTVFLMLKGSKGVFLRNFYWRVSVASNAVFLMLKGSKGVFLRNFYWRVSVASNAVFLMLKGSKGFFLRNFYWACDSSFLRFSQNIPVLFHAVDCTSCHSRDAESRSSQKLARFIDFLKARFESVSCEVRSSH